MRLEPAGTQVDLHQRFKEEARGLPASISLRGNPMQVAVAQALLARHAPDIRVSPEGTAVGLMSMEAYGAAFLASFMERQELPMEPLLFISIPEQLLVAYAQAKGIPVVREEHDDIRRMLDRIAAQQPQTYFSLYRSARRLEQLGN